MATLTPATQSLRLSQCMEVMDYMGTGMTQKDACNLAGISPDTYRRWMVAHPDALITYRSLHQQVRTTEMHAIIMAQIAVMDRLVERATDSDNPIDTADLLNIKRYMDGRLEKIVDQQGSMSSDEEAAQAYLQGPKLVEATSRLSGGKSVNVQIDGDKVDITVTDQPEIIDGEIALTETQDQSHSEQLSPLLDP
jgi:hypothetical protein